MMHLSSVLLYLGVFLLSLFLLRLSQTILFHNNVLVKRNTLLGIGFAIFALLIPCVFASVRGLNVGKDIGTYIIPNIGTSKEMIKNGFLYYYETMPKSTEIGFAYILYIGNYFDNIGLSFFIMQILTIVPVYWALIKYREHVSMTLGMATYFFLCYNFSLSGMRVSISMSLLLLMSYYLYIGKKKQVLILSFLAFLFHTSTILIVSLYLIIFYLHRYRYRTKIFLYLLLGLILIFVFSNQLLNIIINVIGFINPRYVYYISEYLTGEVKSEDVYATDFLCKSTLILIPSWYLLIYKKMNDYCKYFLAMCIVGRLFVLANSIFYESMRIAFYFDMFLVLYASTMCNRIFRNRVKRSFATMISIAPSFFYWLYFVMYIGAWDTNVYTFR